MSSKRCAQNRRKWQLKGGKTSHRFAHLQKRAGRNREKLNRRAFRSSESGKSGAHSVFDTVKQSRTHKERTKHRVPTNKSSRTEYRGRKTAYFQRRAVKGGYIAKNRKRTTITSRKCDFCRFHCQLEKVTHPPQVKPNRIIKMAPETIGQKPSGLGGSAVPKKIRAAVAWRGDTRNENGGKE